MVMDNIIPEGYEEYIEPKNATQLRIYRVEPNSWAIDAIDEWGNFTDATCYVTSIEKSGERKLMTTPDEARAEINRWARDHVPHLVGTEPVIFDPYERKVRIGQALTPTDIAW